MWRSSRPAGSTSSRTARRRSRRPRTPTPSTPSASRCWRARPCRCCWTATRRSPGAPTSWWPRSPTWTSRTRSRRRRGSRRAPPARPAGCSCTSWPRPPSTPGTPTSSGRPSTARSRWAERGAAVGGGCDDERMLLADVVATSAAVGATRSRTAKTAALADLLRAAAPDEVEPVTAWLAGEARQGRIGAGWRTLGALDAAPAATPSLQVGAVDAALDELAGTSGAGSTARRAALLGALFGAATRDEQQFLRRLIGGELRQGALEGVMLEAVAAAAEVPAAVVRRAFMLSGRLPGTAALALTGGAEALEAVSLRGGTPARPLLAPPPDTLDAARAHL